MRSCSVLKNKLQRSSCEPTKAHITTKEFVMSLSIGLLQVYSHSGNKVNANLQHFLEINSKTPDESLNHVTENPI